ncbi:hypothetical protein [Sphingomicrobium nitratireducens]|uniref:hypothetical protein n=1 Tax=Sphingomicrobium nitratireducens TaxID=2964666 RepID=UPI0022400117|nr:hypothetical protein [Sphingomicrobium nitratireducens]
MELSKLDARQEQPQQRERERIDQVLKVDRWQTAKAAFELAQSIHDAETDDHKSDITYELVLSSQRAMFETPAPDGAALWYKLDLLFGPTAMAMKNPDETHCPSWAKEWIGPAIEDAKRFLEGR